MSRCQNSLSSLSSWKTGVAFGGPIAIHWSIVCLFLQRLPNKQKTTGRGTEKDKKMETKEKRRKRKGRRAKEKEREKNACGLCRHIKITAVLCLRLELRKRSDMYIVYIEYLDPEGLKTNLTNTQNVSRNFSRHLETLEWHVCYDSCYSMMICDGSWIKIHLSRLCISAATFDCNWDMLLISATRLERNSSILRHVRTRAANIANTLRKTGKSRNSNLKIPKVPNPTSQRRVLSRIFQALTFILWHPLTSTSGTSWRQHKRQNRLLSSKELILASLFSPLWSWALVAAPATATTGSPTFEKTAKRHVALRCAKDGEHLWDISYTIHMRLDKLGNAGIFHWQQLRWLDFFQAIQNTFIHELRSYNLSEL